mmetsp:Transcript_17372/g.41143  ORF Transcript_17372/g.41143 Transcript_17372/m.41143 type:complete len:374 (+) Transcript_17372:81-1202(+)
MRRKLSLNSAGELAQAGYGRSGFGFADPDAVVVAIRSLLPVAAIRITVPRPQRDPQSRGFSDLRNVKVRISTSNVDLVVHLDAALFPQLQQRGDALSHVIAPIADMVPENAGDAWMGQDVGVADDDLVARERPVRLGTAGVMVVEEGHRMAGHPPEEPWWLAVGILQPPVLAVPHCLLQDALGCEVKSGALFVSSVDPVDSVLPVLVLVVAQAIAIIRHVKPELAHGPGGLALLAVEAHVLRAVAFDKVEAPSIEADLQAQPSQPNGDALLHLLVAVVDVWGSVELVVELARAALAGAVRELVPQSDGPALPVHDAGKALPVLDARGGVDVPPALGVLLVATAVIDDNVRHAAQALVAHGRKQLLQGILLAVC